MIQVRNTASGRGVRIFVNGQSLLVTWEDLEVVQVEIDRAFKRKETGRGVA